MPSLRAQENLPLRFFVDFFNCSTFFMMWLCAVTAKRELHVSVDENGFWKI
jgi:hypothetical protein